jgi:hypothetical protein
LSRTIAFVGDTHGRIVSLYSYLLAWQDRTGVTLDGVVQVGDFNVMRGITWEGATYHDFGKLWDGEYQVPIPTWVCLGNHEDFGLAARWVAEPERIPNLRLMPDGCITDVLGVKMGAVWGNFSPKSYNQPARVQRARQNVNFKGDRPKYISHIDHGAIDRLMSQVSARLIPVPGPSEEDTANGYVAEFKRQVMMDVLISHDAPSCFRPQFKKTISDEELRHIMGLDTDEKLGGCPGLTQIIEKFHPAYHFFGHFHTRDEEVWPRGNHRQTTKIICLHAYNYNPSDSIHTVLFE